MTTNATGGTPGAPADPSLMMAPGGSMQAPAPAGEPAKPMTPAEKKAANAAIKARAKELGISPTIAKQIQESGGDIARYADLKKKVRNGTATQEEQAEFLKQKNRGKSGQNLDQKARGNINDPALQRLIDPTLQTGGGLARGLATGAEKLGDLVANPGSLVGGGATNPLATAATSAAMREGEGRGQEISQTLARKGRSASGIGVALNAANATTTAREVADARLKATMAGEQLARGDLAQVIPLIQERQQETQFGRSMLAGESAARNAAAAAGANQKIGTATALASMAAGAFGGPAAAGAVNALGQTQMKDEEKQPITSSNASRPPRP